MRRLNISKVTKLVTMTMVATVACIAMSGYETIEAADAALSKLNSEGTEVEETIEEPLFDEEDTYYPAAGIPVALTTSEKEEVEKDPVTEVNYEMYVTSVINVREQPNTDCEVLGKYTPGSKITVLGEIEGNDFVMINFKGQEAYVHSEYLSEEEPEIKWQGPTINRWNGTNNGPSGKETYYNLPMEGCIRLARSIGIGGTYWVRADGCKMLGNYIMVATDVHRWPKGTILETSLGTAMVVDHCGSASRYSGRWIDIAVNW